MGHPSQKSKGTDRQKLMTLIGNLCCAFEGDGIEKSRGNEPGSVLPISGTHDYPRG
jgi:hypothetical protein